MATHSSIPAWIIPWMEESGGLQSIGSQRVGHDGSDLARLQVLSWESASHSVVSDSLQPYGL